MKKTPFFNRKRFKILKGWQKNLRKNHSFYKKWTKELQNKNHIYR